jgi:hypothetical protein
MTMKTLILVAVSAALASGLSPAVLHPVTPAYAQEKVAPPSREAIQYSYAPIVRKVAPAVVNVYVRTHVQTFASPFGNDPWFRRFFGGAFGQPSERVLSSLGSGVIINPAFVQGPALDGDLSTSHELYRLMARGVYPAAPRIRFPVADVRDVAEVHAEAAFRPEAAGRRYLVGEGGLSLYELGRILAREIPDLRSKVPKFELPDVAVRMLAVFDKRLRTILPELGEQKDYTNARIRADLGMNLRSADEAAKAAVRSLRDLRLI